MSKVGIGIMSFRQAADLARSIESVRHFQPKYDLIAFIDPCRDDLDREQVDVCKQLGVEYILHEKWQYQPGAFSAVCNTFLDRGYDFCIAHHHDSIFLGPVVDLCLETFNKWKDIGVECAAVQPHLKYSGHNGIPNEDWFDEPLDHLLYRGQFYNAVRDQTWTIPGVDCEWLVNLRAWNWMRPIPDDLYFFHYGFSALAWLNRYPLVAAPEQDCYVLHTGLRTWPESFEQCREEANRKFGQAAELFAEAFPYYDAATTMREQGMLGRSLPMPYFKDGNRINNVDNAKYPVAR